MTGPVPAVPDVWSRAVEAAQQAAWDMDPLLAANDPSGVAEAGLRAALPVLLADLRAAGLGLHIEPDSSGEPVLWKRNDNDTRWRALCGRNDMGHEAWALIAAALAAAPSGEPNQPPKETNHA